MERPTLDELLSRVRTTCRRDSLDRETIAAWYGYLAALLEWSLISVGDHAEVVAELPSLDPNPTVDILLGREEGQD